MKQSLNLGQELDYNLYSFAGYNHKEEERHCHSSCASLACQLPDHTEAQPHEDRCQGLEMSGLNAEKAPWCLPTS